MSEEVKFTDDELKVIKDLRTDYLDIQNEFGQLKLAKIRLNRQEDQLLQNLSEIENSEKSFLDKIEQNFLSLSNTILEFASIIKGILVN